MVSVADLGTENMATRILVQDPRLAPYALASRACRLMKPEHFKLGCCKCCTCHSFALDFLAFADADLEDRASAREKAVERHNRRV